MSNPGIIGAESVSPEVLAYLTDIKKRTQTGDIELGIAEPPEHVVITFEDADQRNKFWAEVQNDIAPHMHCDTATNSIRENLLVTHILEKGERPAPYHSGILGLRWRELGALVTVAPLWKKMQQVFDEATLRDIAFNCAGNDITIAEARMRDTPAIRDIASRLQQTFDATGADYYYAEPPSLLDENKKVPMFSTDPGILDRMLEAMISRQELRKDRGDKNPRTRQG